MVASFDDGKDEGALRTIGEVGEALGIKAHVLRYWEGQFPQLQPLKRSGGRRYYRPGDIALLKQIDRLVNQEGYTLRGAKAALQGGKVHDAGSSQAADTGVVSSAGADMNGTPAANRSEALAKLREIRTLLAEALEA